jgi:Aspartyl protease
MPALDLIIQPDEDDADAAQVLVDGVIDGHPYRFLLDTGAARSRAPFDAYTASFPTNETQRSSGVFASRAYDLITVPHLTVGPISRRVFTMVRAPQHSPDQTSLIGMDLLKDYCCQFLFDEHKVLLDPLDATAAPHPLQELLLGPRGHPYVDVTVGEVSAKAIWDSGGSVTVADLSFVRNHPALFEEAGYSTGTDPSGTQSQTPMFLMAATTIDSQNFAPHRVAGVDLSGMNATLETPIELGLGYPTLSQANWIFDFPRQRWAITKRLL